MAINSKSTAYIQPWHFDCRLSKELPDDKPVRGRFLANLLACAFALGGLMYTGFTFYSHELVQSDITDWQHRLEENRAETDSLKGVTTAITNGTKRIDDAYALISTPLVVSDFVQEIGITRPPNVRLETIESNAGAIFIRGGLHETSQRASAQLSRYVADLRADTRLAPFFASITLTSWERNSQADTINFEITFKLKADSP